jgi:hypothetical protein
LKLEGVGALAPSLVRGGMMAKAWNQTRVSELLGIEWLLNKALRIDDDVAEALYSGNRRVST